MDGSVRLRGELVDEEHDGVQKGRKTPLVNCVKFKVVVVVVLVNLWVVFRNYKRNRVLIF